MYTVLQTNLKFWNRINIAHYTVLDIRVYYYLRNVIFHLASWNITFLRW